MTRHLLRHGPCQVTVILDDNNLIFCEDPNTNHTGPCTWNGAVYAAETVNDALEGVLHENHIKASRQWYEALGIGVCLGWTACLFFSCTLNLLFNKAEVLKQPK